MCMTFSKVRFSDITLAYVKVQVQFFHVYGNVDYYIHAFVCWRKKGKAR